MGAENLNDILSEANNITPRHGLLDIKLQLSHSDPLAGNDFKIYLLVTNLFDKPIWVNAPRVAFPSELKLIPQPLGRIDELSSLLEMMKELKSPIIYEPKSLLEKLFDAETSKTRKILRYFAEAIERLDRELQDLEEKIAFKNKEIYDLTEQIDRELNTKPLGEKIEIIKGNEKIRALKSEKDEISKQADNVRNRITQTTTQIVSFTGSTAIVADGNIILDNLPSARSVFVRVIGDGRLKFSDEKALNTLWETERQALQPGNTFVAHGVFNTNKKTFFRPIQYAIQYSVDFSFDRERTTTHTNISNQQLTIRAPIESVIQGSILGGIAGFVASSLQKTDIDSLSGLTFPVYLLQYGLPLLLTTILSAMAVVFLARKSETQSLVSIEDFWGGLVIGFLVGYTGTSFFSSLVTTSPVAPALDVG